MALTPEQKVAAATLRAKNAMGKVTPMGGTPVNMANPGAPMVSPPVESAPILTANSAIPAAEGLGGKALRFVGRAGPVLSGAAAVYDVATRATAKDPRPFIQSDLENNLASRGMGASEAAMWATDQSGYAPESSLSAANRNMAELNARRLNMAADRAPARGHDPYDQMVRTGTKPQYETPVAPSAAALTHAPVGKPGDVEAPAAPAAPVDPYKKMQAAGGTMHDELPIPGTSAVYTDSFDPTGNDNRRRADVPGRGFAEIQRGTGVDDASILKGARNGGRGGFVGAATDAEAARNLQARAEQSAAAQQMISSMNAGAEAERDLRATKLGISRGTLDAMEGRGGSYASEGPMTVVGQEGVNFGDEAGRQSRIEGLINRAASETGGRTGSKRAEAMLGAAQALQAPGMEQAKNDAELGKQNMASQATMNAAQTKANADLTTGRMKEVGDNYRAKLTYQGQTDAARIGQGGQDARLLFTEGKAGEREGAKALEARRTEGSKLWNAAVTPQGKGQYAEVNPGHAKQFFDQMDVDSVVEGMPGVSKETVQRWKRQDFLPNEVPTMKAWVQAWGQSQDPPGPNFVRNIPTAHDIMGIKRKPTE